jgi:hypothetical protein
VREKIVGKLSLFAAIEELLCGEMFFAKLLDFGEEGLGYW